MRTLTLPLAFLSAAFMLACQDQGSEPVGPEGLGILLDRGPIHDHGGGGDEADNPGSATYDYVFAGVITTDPSPGGASGGGPGGGVGLRCGPCDIEGEEALIVLNQFGECFTDPEFRLDEFSGQLRPDKKDPTMVQAVFNFKAFGIDGETEFNYNLKLDGLVDVDETTDNDIFPPEDGETTTVDFATVTMNTKGGKDNSAVACTGTVAVLTSVELTGTS